MMKTLLLGALLSTSVSASDFKVGELAVVKVMTIDDIRSVGTTGLVRITKITDNEICAHGTYKDNVFCRNKNRFSNNDSIKAALVCLYQRNDAPECKQLVGTIKQYSELLCRDKECTDDDKMQNILNTVNVLFFDKESTKFINEEEPIDLTGLDLVTN
jgi:hypothetical protein